MGKRATSTTKGGRFMNPADQERKMARKKELKKNKKQRHMVRQAVLKSKDPSDLLVQLEKLDDVEFSDFDSQPLSERVLQEKRSKLRETFLRVMGMYKRDEELEKFGEMKKQLQAYDHKRDQLHRQFIAQKFAREVDPSEIPLPDAAPPPPDSGAAMTPAAVLASRAMGVPFPSEFGGMHAGDFAGRLMGKPAEALQGILKKTRKRSTIPPGPPIGPPPDLSGSSDEEDDEYSKQYERRRTGAYHDKEPPRSDDEDDFDDEESNARRPSGEEAEGDEAEYDEEGNELPSKNSRVRFDEEADDDKDSRSRYKEMARMIERGDMPPPQGRMDEEAGSSGGARIPPPPSLMVPPGMPSHMIRPGVPMPGLGSIRPGVRMPLPPHPGFPSRMQRPPNFVGQGPGIIPSATAVLSAPPAINKLKQSAPAAIIEAKPQMRNMRQEVTKLVPTALKIRRDQHAVTQAQKKPAAKGPLIFRTPETKISVPGGSVQHAPQKSSDEAYDDFMKEMKSLL